MCYLRTIEENIHSFINVQLSVLDVEKTTFKHVAKTEGACPSILYTINI